jgi:hypothetical protein
MLRGQDDFWGNLVEAAMFETCPNLLLCNSRPDDKLQFKRFVS